MPSGMASDSSPPKLLDQLRHALTLGHYSLRAIDAYTTWVRRYFLVSTVQRHPLLRSTDVSRMANMTSRAQALLREALALPAEERADVAAELLASLDKTPSKDHAEVEAAWAHEIERRARRVMNGESDDEAWADVRARLLQRFAKP